MKSLPSLLIVLSACVLGYVALRAPDPSYEAPALDEPPELVPVVLSGDAPQGYRVVSLEVEGMCCDGCSAKLHSAMMSLDTVEEAAVDFVLGRAQAVVPAGFDGSSVAAALTFDKYSARVLP